jgi:hypothetical protein
VVDGMGDVGRDVVLAGLGVLARRHLLGSLHVADVGRGGPSRGRMESLHICNLRLLVCDNAPNRWGRTYINIYKKVFFRNKKTHQLWVGRVIFTLSFRGVMCTSNIVRMLTTLML